MAAVTNRRLDDEAHREIEALAKRNGRSTEAEMRAILVAAVPPSEKFKLGSWLHARAMEFGGVDLDIARDKTPARFPDFSRLDYDGSELE